MKMLCFPGSIFLRATLPALMLVACATGSPPETDVMTPAATAMTAPDPAAGPVYRIDPDAGSARILVFRGGTAARLGHNHVLAVASMSGYVQVPQGRAEEGRFALSFRLDGLRIDPAALRQSLGANWASEVSAEAADGTRTNMLRSLEAEKFPEVRIRSLRLAGAAPKLAAQVEVDLHGQRRAIWLPLDVEVSEAQVKATGSLVIRQSEFGIQPFTVLGGLLSVQDELVVEFDLRAVR
ncbi:YceI family protein [Paucibacter sp. R3-3]|uniref:YceI family protein n=1 Tax=Roseateles agri TaxID=3098619 RepID=A0ABU5DPG7_9BURK|nr:YceI family protein [Paucibacter sp. R3-3]MDY0748206.1 YceI family protein [Paucibacter sp. R3-3]